MDKEEAIWHLKRCKKRIPLMNTLGELCKSKTIESIDMAIEALQAQTDGDLISKQALCQYALNQKDKSVTPNDIMRFPSADRPTGKWIYVTVEEWLRIGRDYGHHCSECDEINECGKSNFCPNCGADMRGNKE